MTIRYEIEPLHQVPPPQNGSSFRMASPSTDCARYSSTHVTSSSSHHCNEAIRGMFRGLMVTFIVGSRSADPNVDFASVRPFLVPPSDHFQLTLLTLAALTVVAIGEKTKDMATARIAAVPKLARRRFILALTFYSIEHRMYHKRLLPLNLSRPLPPRVLAPAA